MELIVELIVALIVLVVYIVLIKMLVKEAISRGYSPEKKALLWLIGLFLSPILLAIYVLCFLPSKKGE
jgi:drug/metabolite transporter (DMT)-like permease